MPNTMKSHGMAVMKKMMIKKNRKSKKYLKNIKTLTKKS